MTLSKLFEAQAGRTPDAVAVICGDASVTYQQLDAEADRLARRLTARGARPESLVAVAMERSAELVATLLAVAKAGAAYVPVDLGYPAERIAFMLADARPAIIVTDRAALQDLPVSTVLATIPILVADEYTEDSAPGAESAVGLRPDHPAYVIYTSGSTGTPKGVVVSHAGLPSLAAGQAERFGTGPGSRVLAFSSPGFDASVSELVVTLSSGGALVIPGS